MPHIHNLGGGPAAGLATSLVVLADTYADGSKPTRLIQEITLELENTDASVALNAFKVSVQAIPGGAWVQYAAGTDYATPGTSIIRCVGTPASLAGAAKAVMTLRFHGVYGVKFEASTASTGSAKVKGFVRLD